MIILCEGRVWSDTQKQGHEMKFGDIIHKYKSTNRDGLITTDMKIW